MPHPLEGLDYEESREITWDVTQEDIDHGNQGDCWKCPIARSLCRLFPDYAAEADHTQLGICEPEFGMAHYAATTPENACDFMWAFDDDGDAADGRPEYTKTEAEAIIQPFSITAVFTRVA